MKRTLPLLTLLFALAFTGRAEEVRTCPPWEVTVVDTNGRPVANCTVLQEWGYQFGRASTNYATNVLTDAAGRISLPERWVTSPETRSKVKIIVDRFATRESEGPWATLFVWKNGYEGTQVHAWGDGRVLFTAQGLRSKIVLSPEKPAK